MEKFSWAIQDGLLCKVTGKLQSLWMEIPGRCNLACRYCFACAGEKLEESKLMTWEVIEKILEEAAKMGVTSFGIPGAGEPLLPTNRKLTMRILRKCADLNIFVSLFTTSEFITAELANELFNLPVELLVKCNTLNPELQDRFVSDPKRGRIIHNYGAKRNAKIQLLMNKGFADDARCRAMFGRKSRLGLVTSIMTSEEGELSNLDHVANILRFCRQNNLIFDSDSVLKRGRGIVCGLSLGDEEYKQKVFELQRIDREEFGNEWTPTQSYVGGPACDRCFHHLYVDQYGTIHPCVGAMGIELGNIRETNLEEAWNKPEMEIIRNRKYKGRCGDECANFAEGKCNSCLGRRTINLTNKSLLADGCVKTIGCWNFKKK